MSASSPEQSYYQSLLPLEGSRPDFFALGTRGWVGTAGVAIGVIMLGAGVVWSTSVPELGFLLVGMGLGSGLRDIGYRRKYVASWPLLDAVIAWDTVRARSGASENGSPPPDGKNTEAPPARP